MTFRLLARTYFEREAERKLIPPELNNCPTECANSGRYYDPRRSAFCADCPHKIERDAFREQTEQTVVEIIGNVRFDFGKTLSLFYAARNHEDAPRDNISVRSAAFSNVYLSEKRRFEAIKDAAK